MKFIAVLITLAAVALASPNRPPPPPPPPPTCKPGTYGCAKNAKTGVDGWQVCDVTQKWVYAGDCPPNTQCVFLAINGSPYCIPK